MTIGGTKFTLPAASLRVQHLLLNLEDPLSTITTFYLLHTLR